MPPKPSRLLITWQKQHTLWHWRAVCLTAVQEQTVLVPFLITLYTSDLQCNWVSPPPETLRGLSCCGVCPWWTGGGVQRTCQSSRYNSEMWLWFSGGSTLFLSWEKRGGAALYSPGLEVQHRGCLQEKTALHTCWRWEPSVFSASCWVQSAVICWDSSIRVRWWTNGSWVRADALNEKLNKEQCKAFSQHKQCDKKTFTIFRSKGPVKGKEVRLLL